ncbi:MAG: aspartate aminotransferase family protein [Chloroflexi bacterium]|nr:aspartate aminotransferase family protein [Chloroflexota bacterium]
MPHLSSIHLVTEIPGPKSRELVARREAAAPNGAAKLTNIAIASAAGSVVTDVDGNQLLDMAGGIGVLAVGHCPDNVVEAIQAQASQLLHMCGIVATYEPMVEAAELMNAIAPGDFAKKTLFMNSGAEAVETAVNIARAHTKRAGIIVFEGAYHGRTNLTLGMTSKYALFKKGFGPFPAEIYRLPFPNLYRRPAPMSEEEYVDFCISQLNNALIAQIDPNYVAAIVIEPVQGEGGFVPTPPRFMRRIREICDEYGIVMIADEIQAGFGRTGKLFAMEHYGVAADLMTTAKSLGAGLPISAVTGRADMMDAPHPGGLGGTYSANPIACVAAIEAIKMIREPAFLERAQAVGVRLRGHLEAIQAKYPQVVGDVRGVGPMLVLELVKDPISKAPNMELTGAITAATLQRGLITIRAGLYSNCVRFLPALNITDDQIDEGMAILDEVMGEVVGK